MLKATFKVPQGKYVHSFPVMMDEREGRIHFVSIPFSKALNAEIKAMRGAKFDWDAKKWSVESCPRNLFQIRLLLGENPYEHFEQTLMPLAPKYPLKEHQVDMVRRALTYHYQIWSAEMRLGKTLAAIETVEQAKPKGVWYIGPKSAIASVELEFEKWKASPPSRMLTYEGLVNIMRYDFEALKAPQMVIFDETDGLKNPTTHRAIAAQALADLVREQWGMDGYVLLLSGSPTAKNPTDIWSQAEVAWPGFLREGSFQAFERRYAVLEEQTDLDGVTFHKRVGWREEEVEQLPARLEGLMAVYRRADWLELPPKLYRTVKLEPSSKVLRVARTLAKVAPNTITGLTWLRGLSSGFQYTTKQVGMQTCPVCGGTGSYSLPVEGVCPGCSGTKMVPEYGRETVMVDTPKDLALRDLLKENEERQRVVVYASFQGSIDRAAAICEQEGWECAIVDGRGWRVVGRKDEALRFWTYHEGKVAFIGNPASCRYGLDLTKANMEIFYDNSFSAVHRLQSEDRVVGPAMDGQVTIVDLIHLPVDQLVIDTLKQNRKLELLSLGAIRESLGADNDTDSEASASNLELAA